jgi:hypothetical protein
MNRRKTLVDFLPPELQAAVLQVNEDAPRGASLSDDDRARHLFVVGSIGSGKSKLLESMVFADIARRLDGVSKRGFIFFDVHGDSADNIIDWLSVFALKYPELYDNTLIIDPTITDYRLGWNPLELIPGQSAFDRAQALTDGIVHIYDDDATVVVRMQSVLLHSFWALALAGKTLLDFTQFVMKPPFRNNLLTQINQPILTDFFSQQFPGGTKNEGGFNQQTVDWVGSSNNRLGRLIENPRFAPILGQQKSSFHFRELMDEGRFVIVRCPKGQVGDQATYLLCALLMSAIQEASMSRENLRPGQRIPCTLYLDEFLNFSNKSQINLLAEHRKYRLEMCLASQRVAGLERHEDVLKAALSIAQTLVAFRTSYADADVLAREMFVPDVMSVKDERPRILQYGNLPIVIRDKVYFSLEELREMERRRITTLPDRHFWMYTRRTSETRLVRSLPVTSASDRATVEQLAFARSRLHQAIAQRYTHPQVSVELPPAKPYSIREEHPKPALLDAPQTRSTEDEFGGKS